MGDRINLHFSERVGDSRYLDRPLKISTFDIDLRGQNQLKIQ